MGRALQSLLMEKLQYMCCNCIWPRPATGTLAEPTAPARELTLDDKWLAEREKEAGVIKTRKGLLYRVLTAGTGVANVPGA